MRVCLITSPEDRGELDGCGPLAALLANSHEVVVVRAGPSGPAAAPAPAGGAVREIAVEPEEGEPPMLFSCEEHCRSAAVRTAVEEAFGADGPDYVEFTDRGAAALVALQARRGGSPALRGTAFAARLIGSAELTGLHDAELGAPGMERLCDLEREQLRLADRIVWPGGEGLDLYRGYHREIALPEGVRIGIPLAIGDPPEPRQHERDRPLRVLHVGPYSRASGAGDLAEACLRLPREDWELTMAGPDTATTPFKQSMRASIEEMFGGDPRVTIAGPAAAEERARLYAEHDVLAVPSRFGVWPLEALEAMAAGLPVLATPVGGHGEIVEHGRTGWLTGGIGREAVRDALAALLERREDLERVAGSDAVSKRARSLSDPEAILSGYDRLLKDLAPAGRRDSVPRPRSDPPLVSAIVPYFRSSAHIEEAVRSMREQTHADHETIIVNDGSFEPEDEILDRIAEIDRVRVVTQLNGGEAAARNLGLQLARGEYLMMLDSDNLIDAEFVERALEVFAREPDVPYVTCWERFIGPDSSPHPESAGIAYMGNRVLRDDTENWDGDNLALLPRRLLLELGYFQDVEAASHVDWEFYRRLREEGRYGVAIPECLASYRVLPGSLMRSWSEEVLDRGWDEHRDRRLSRAIVWTGGVDGR